MQSIRLGCQGAQVPPLGPGCMRMSGPPATRDDTEAIATIRASLDAGVGFLDTGDYYGHGHNESLMARAINGRRDDAFLSVKFGGLRSARGNSLTSTYAPPRSRISPPTPCNGLGSR
jgi:aryl-alcohol dehydrogenase-like predicted oxidoreductase